MSELVSRHRKPVSRLRKLVLGFIEFDFGLHKIRGNVIDGQQSQILKICKCRGGGVALKYIYVNVNVSSFIFWLPATKVAEIMN